MAFDPSMWPTDFLRSLGIAAPSSYVFPGPYSSLDRMSDELVIDTIAKRIDAAVNDKPQSANARLQELLNHDDKAEAPRPNRARDPYELPAIGGWARGVLNHAEDVLVSTVMPSGSIGDIGRKLKQRLNSGNDAQYFADAGASKISDSTREKLESFQNFKKGK